MLMSAKGILWCNQFLDLILIVITSRIYDLWLPIFISLYQLNHKLKQMSWKNTKILKILVSKIHKN